MAKAEAAVSPEEIIASGRHAFIEASAGSGKTTRLTALVREIVSSGRAQIGQILCVTFTEKAAAELKAKIFAELAKTNNDNCRQACSHFSENQIGTIHSFCLKSLAENPLANLTDQTPDSGGDEEIFEEAREWVYRTLWTELPVEKLSACLTAVRFGTGGQKRQFDTDLRQKALWCFAAGNTPIVPFVSDADGVRDGATFRAWTLYAIVNKMREIAAARNTMTFSRMITGLEHALKDKGYAQKIRSQYRYALIDEFQDTDTVQWQIFRTLFLQASETPARLIVVGDPKQAIYKFRGADVFVYLAARRELEALGAITCELGTNYRSSRALLNFHDTLFTRSAAATTWSRAEITYHEPQCGRTDTAQSEATAVEIYTAPQYKTQLLEQYAAVATGRIAALRAEHPEWTIAIIAYRHRSLQIFAESLRTAGIEFSYYKQQPDFSRTEVLHLRTLLHSLQLDAAQGLALAETTIFLKDRADGETWYARLYSYAAQGRIVSLLQQLAQDQLALHRLLENGGDASVWHAWRVLMQTLLEACGKTVHDTDSLLQFLIGLQQGDEDNNARGDMLRETNAVTLLTVQSAKGLDWNAVVLADGHNDKRWADFAFFHDRAGNAVVPAEAEAFLKSGDYLLTIEEEARIAQLNLLYVALTRPKDRLLLFTAASSKNQAPGPVSFFLADPGAIDLPAGTIIRDLESYPLAAYKRTAPKTLPAPQPVEHGNIARRYGERTSFTALSESHFTETDFIEDILPRGAETGQLLHNLLETCDFAALSDNKSEHALKLQERIAREVEEQISDDPDLKPAIADRIFSIVHAGATAALPLKPGALAIRLCDVHRDNLWREMPFWSAAAIHRVLRDKHDDVRRIMHGYMDLVFTPDAKFYYILDYKSNSLSGVAPELIGDYVRDHYALQAQIYLEALQAYLNTHYPGSGRTVAGCYFVFLRYLKPGDSTGVHFIDAANALR